MQFTITINGEGAELAQALRALKTATDAAAGYEITTGVVQASIEPEKPKRTRTSPKTDESVKPDQVDKPVEDEEDNNEPNPDAMGDEDIPTVVDLRAKARDVGKTLDGKEAIRALLDKYESAAISNVPEDKRIAFMAELGKI